jgi:hypothetical protein
VARILHRDDPGKIPVNRQNQPFAAWLPDGSGFYYISLGDRNPSNHPRFNKQGLSLWTAGATSGKPVVMPGIDGADVDGVTVMGNGTLVVELAHFANGADIHDLYVLDPQSGQATMQLTQGGNSHHPVW